MKEICPLMSRVVVMRSIEGGEVSEMKWIDCQGKNCRFWGTTYSSELIAVEGCSFELMAHKSSDGLYIMPIE